MDNPSEQPGELVTAAGRLRDRLSSFSTVTWSTLTVEAAEFGNILARINGAVEARDAAVLDATYVALNDLDSRLPAGAHRSYGRQTAGAAPDPLWEKLRVNETLDRLTALTQPEDNGADSEPKSKRRRWPWERE